MRKKLFAPAVIVPRLAAGDLGLYDTATLLEVLYAPANAPELRGFWNRFFPQEIHFTTEKIMFDDIDTNEYRLAPFVAPNVQGRVMASKGFSTRSFKPAYVKPKHVIDPFRNIFRRAGETPGFGSLTPGQRFDLAMADNLRRERAMIENRIDWMQCQAIRSGSVVVAGEDYPTVTVSYGRDASLSETLGGAALWTANTATPIADIQTKRNAAFKLSKAPITDLIFGMDAFAAFILGTHDDVQVLLNAMRIGNDSLFNASGISDGGPFQYQGILSGTNGIAPLRMWTYANYYESDGTDGNTAGVGIPYFHPGEVIGVGNALDGVMAYGAIMDRRAQLQALSMFPKVWDEEDPSVTYSMTQSAPLPVPRRPNNSFKLRVTA